MQAGAILQGQLFMCPLACRQEHWDGKNCVVMLGHPSFNFPSPCKLSPICFSQIIPLGF